MPSKRKGEENIDTKDADKYRKWSKKRKKLTTKEDSKDQMEVVPKEPLPPSSYILQSLTSDIRSVAVQLVFQYSIQENADYKPKYTSKDLRNCWLAKVEIPRYKDKQDLVFIPELVSFNSDDSINNTALLAIRELGILEDYLKSPNWELKGSRKEKKEQFISIDLTYQPVDENSTGAKLMRLMGWKGKGLGKNESGITQPVDPPLWDASTRSGLGYSDGSSLEEILEGRLKKIKVNKEIPKDFKKRVEEIILAFCDSEEKAIKFSSSLTNEDRKWIHKLVRAKTKLTTKSIGKGNLRALCLAKTGINVSLLDFDSIRQVGYLADDDANENDLRDILELIPDYYTFDTWPFVMKPTHLLWEAIRKSFSPIYSEYKPISTLNGKFWMQVQLPFVEGGRTFVPDKPALTMKESQIDAAMKVIQELKIPPDLIK